MTKPYVIPIFIPHQGCPHQCVYCNQKTITGAKAAIDLSEIKKNINFFLSRKRHPKRSQVQIAFYGGTFTALEPSLRQELLKIGWQLIKEGKVDCLRLSTRPDAIDKPILKELWDFGVRIVELGVQSLDNKVLKLARRGHDAASVFKATELIRRHGFQVGWQLMPGLPGETPESRQYTLEQTLKFRPDLVRIYPTLVIKNTVLARWWQAGRYQPLSLEEAIEICRQMYVAFKAAGIKVVRMGLQATTSLLRPGEIMAGPWHPAFGELVKAAVWLDVLARAINQTTGSEIMIQVCSQDLPQAIGHKRHNIELLKRKFPQKRIVIVKDLMLKKGEVKIIDGKVCLSCLI